MENTEQREEVHVIDSVVTAGQNVQENNKKMFGYAFGGVLTLAALVSLGVGAYRVYAKTPTDGFSVAVAKILHLPAAKINGHRIAYADYVSDLKAITQLRQYDREHPSESGGSDAANLTDEQLSDQVFIRIINNSLVNDAALEMNVQIEEKDIVDVREQLKQRFGSIDEAEKGLKEHYGWNLQQYEERVIRPLILQNKIAEKVSSDEVGRNIVKSQALQVLNQIKQGSSFEELAKQYGQDGTASRGGDLGEFRAGDMVQPFEDAVKALKKNEVAKDLIETPYGYHIVRSDGTRQEKTKDEKGKTVNQPVYSAHHILFMYPSINQKLADMLKKSTFKMYIKAHNPLDTAQLK